MAYRQFVTSIYAERLRRPSALRDILALPIDVTEAVSKEDFDHLLRRQDIPGNNNLWIKGLTVRSQADDSYILNLAGEQKRRRYQALADHMVERFPGSEANVEVDHLVIAKGDRLDFYLTRLSQPKKASIFPRSSRLMKSPLA